MRVGMRATAIVAALAMSGCSLLKNTDWNAVIAYGGRAVALGMCVVSAAKSSDPTTYSAECIKLWAPELPARYAVQSANLTDCVSNVVEAAKSADPEVKQSYVETQVATCAAKYVGPIVVADQATEKE